ncbi:hypothetical protein CVV65_01020 [Kyrpidia spormannii]|uniref:Uncharacterized protein n=2 Tax=Kyrpidia spormannii TaxID=2055160 RepID=A0A2K8N4A0_9BACL|nr:hypothetical protein CVV65_01020 [Kyrpidia spormannii]CAB3389378.1 conserved protein of unknown function [Kyrpidia spormannii]CAB3390040.1 conserved protein of unknown function [Kyrpidia spormannii]
MGREESLAGSILARCSVNHRIRLDVKAPGLSGERVESGQLTRGRFIEPFGGCLPAYPVAVTKGEKPLATKAIKTFRTGSVGAGQV